MTTSARLIAVAVLMVTLGLISIVVTNRISAVAMRLDHQTNIEISLQREREARALVSQWTASFLRWEQFKDSDRDNERDWANAAMMEANRLASVFNIMMLDHSTDWYVQIPEGLQESIPTIPLQDPDQRPWPLSIG